jgi:hypothetical protein
MKNLKKLLFMLPLLALTALVSCKKDKDDSPSGDASAKIVGSYKGTIDVVGGIKYFDAIIILTKESDGKIKVAPKSGEAYSNVTAKSFGVSFIGGGSQDVTSGSTDPNGILLYENSKKTLTYLSKQTAANDITFSFEGTKE